jgi:hypothetical protein
MPNVTGCHGSCHGSMLRKGPSLLVCHGVTGLWSGEWRVMSSACGPTQVRNQKSEIRRAEDKSEVVQNADLASVPSWRLCVNWGRDWRDKSYGADKQFGFGRFDGCAMGRRHLADCFGRASSSQIKAFQSESKRFKANQRTLHYDRATRSGPGQQADQTRLLTGFDRLRPGLTG